VLTSDFANMKVKVLKYSMVCL